MVQHCGSKFGAVGCGRLDTPSRVKAANDNRVDGLCLKDHIGFDMGLIRPNRVLDLGWVLFPKS